MLENELKRQLSNLRPIVSEIILPEFAALDKQELSLHVRKLCPQLI
jgi:hypothetical protein